MNQIDQRMCQTVIGSRIEIALKRLKETSHFQVMLKKQSETEAMVEELLQKLEKEERITIRRHFEKKVEKEGEELNEAYIQGLKDCIQLLLLLGIFTPKISL